jgi:hypothetical protein
VSADVPACLSKTHDVSHAFARSSSRVIGSSPQFVTQKRSTHHQQSIINEAVATMLPTRNTINSHLLLH